MKKLICATALLGLAGTATAGGIEEMIGTWEWEGYTIEVTACDATDVCAEVIAGPQNIGLQMLESTPEAADDAFTAKVAHPATGETYFTKMAYNGTDAWSMEGCTEAGVCAKGNFTRK
jgi:uncharacterized protein (DUF2147 family)